MVKIAAATCLILALVGCSASESVSESEHPYLASLRAVAMVPYKDFRKQPESSSKDWILKHLESLAGMTSEDLQKRKSSWLSSGVLSQEELQAYEMNMEWLTNQSFQWTEEEQKRLLTAKKSSPFLLDREDQNRLLSLTIGLGGPKLQILDYWDRHHRFPEPDHVLVLPNVSQLELVENVSWNGSSMDVVLKKDFRGGGVLNMSAHHDGNTIQWKCSGSSNLVSVLPDSCKNS